MSRQTINETLKNYFQKDEFSYNVEQWNQQRAEVINEVLNKILYPELEQELETKLVNEAKEFVKKECKKKIKELINVAPYKAEAQQFDDLEQSEYSCRVFAISYSTDPNEVAVCACVNGNGELDEFVRIRKLLSRDNPRFTNRSEFANDRQEKLEDLDKLFKLIIKKRPHVIAVGAENKDALFIIEELRKEIEKEKQIGMISVELVDNDLAKLYASTNIADAEFRDQSPLLKQSIALARQLQDPLLAYAQLCNTDSDILLLKYHPLQDLLTKEEFLMAIEQEFIDEANLVGVDLNRCVKYPHTAHVLQFVSALGPRKSSHIIRTSKHKLPIFTRSFLVTECTLGSKVFVNCAGFIKFDTEALQKENDSEDIEVFDSMRIHPEAYEWARQMCADALDLDDNNDRSSAVKEILESPGRLDTLELDAFAAELERVGSGKRHITLVDIRREFHNCYEERRIPHHSPNDNEKFHMLTKETVVSFKIGKLILCKVTSIARRRPTPDQLENAEPIKDENTCTWQCSFCKRGNFSELAQVWAHFDTGECPGPPVGVRTMLDNQVSGFIPLNALSDQTVKNPEDRLKVGQIIYTRIAKIDVAKFSVELTCRSSDLKDVNYKFRPKRDYFYNEMQEKEDVLKVEEKKRRDEHKQSFTKRVIAHPQFHNIGYQECINMLKDMEIGDSVIRPSSKGIDHLTLTWKVYKDIYQHVDIIEEKKMNQFSIGKRLIIEGEEYEDLDEILARYVHPIGNYTRECINYKYFRADLDSTKPDLIENVLLTEQKNAPSKIPYAFICDRINAGRFVLSYVIKTKVRHEGIKITPEGFRFRGQSHKTFNNLINWFKKHFNDPISLSNAMSINNSNSSRIGTPLNLASAASQRSITSNSPFITPAVPTPRSFISTPSTSALPTPNRSAITTPNRITGGSLTPYSPTNAATPHLQNFDNSAPMDYSASDNDNFRRPTNNNYRGRGGFDNNNRGNWNRGGRGGGGGGGGYRNNSKFNDAESWDDDTTTKAAPSTSSYNSTKTNNFESSSSSSWTRTAPAKSFSNDDESWDNETTVSQPLIRPTPPTTSSFNSRTNESSWNNKKPPTVRQSRFDNNYSAPIKPIINMNKSLGEDDESWDEPSNVKNNVPQQQQQQQIRSPYKAPLPPPVIQQQQQQQKKPPIDEDSWD
jgi:transcription elongation factor SPT6